MLKIYDGKTFLKTYRRPALVARAEEMAAVRAIIDEVKTRGDEALLELTERFDGARLATPKVSEQEFAEAFARAKPEVVEAMKEAAGNIAAFHRENFPQSWLKTKEDGVVLGQLVRPLSRVGVYVPGGGASYPSSVLMTVIPAKIAGVKEVAVATPPDKDGRVDPHVLVAAVIAGTREVYKCGGAQAVAALAFGTESIKKVDKLVGPGNIYVTLAKKEVCGVVGIDALAGPSEILVLADGSANAAFVAADLLSQAEHDVLAASYLVTDSRELACEVLERLREQCEMLPRRSVAQEALASQGALVLVDSLEEGIAVANFIAPEHLELHVRDPWTVLEKIENAGAVFVGEYTPEPAGDYWAGPSHVLPTSGAARFSSPLAVDDFLKKSSVIHYPREALLSAAPAIELLAKAEGLDAHRRAVSIRREGENNDAKKKCFHSPQIGGNGS